LGFGGNIKCLFAGVLGLADTGSGRGLSRLMFHPTSD
jgi:hypothetical protein